MIEHEETIESAVRAKNNAYWERNQLVAVLSKIYPAFIVEHDRNDKDWDKEWLNIIVIILPMEDTDIENERKYPYYRVPGIGKIPGIQLTWHIHDHEMPMFDHLEKQNLSYKDIYHDFGYKWDGHTTEEKYKRLRKFLEKR